MAGIKRGVRNVLDQPLWSRVTVPAAATTEVNFFAVTGNRQITNVASPKTLPGDNKFLCAALRIVVHPQHNGAASFVSLAEMTDLQTGHVEFKVDDSVQFESLVMDVPGGTGVGGLYGEGAVATTMALSNGAADRRAFRLFAKPIEISKQQNFEVNIKWPAAVTMGVACDVFCFLDGVYSRRPL